MKFDRHESYPWQNPFSPWQIRRNTDGAWKRRDQLQWKIGGFWWPTQQSKNWSVWSRIFMHLAVEIWFRLTNYRRQTWSNCSSISSFFLLFPCEVSAIISCVHRFSSGNRLFLRLTTTSAKTPRFGGVCCPVTAMGLLRSQDQHNTSGPAQHPWMDVPGRKGSAGIKG